MDNRFFPHATDGSNNIRPSYTFTSTFNMAPNTAIALDARSIISEWTNESRRSMKKDEVYVGQQIYCLNDKILRVCRWVPGVGNYTADNCLWDILHTEDDDSATWVNVETYTPAKPIDEIIEEEKIKTWRFVLEPDFGYIGFYKFENSDIAACLEDETVLNKTLNTLVHGAENDDVLSEMIFDFSKGTQDISFNGKTPAAWNNAKNGYLIAFIPDACNMDVVKLTLNTSVVQTEDLEVFMDELEFMPAGQVTFDSAIYRAYALNAAKLTDLTGVSVTITFDDFE